MNKKNAILGSKFSVIAFQQMLLHLSGPLCSVVWALSIINHTSNDVFPKQSLLFILLHFVIIQRIAEKLHIYFPYIKLMFISSDPCPRGSTSDWLFEIKVLVLNGKAVSTIDISKDTKSSLQEKPVVLEIKIMAGKISEAFYCSKISVLRRLRH